MAAKPIPEGFTTITPYLIAKGAAAAIEFYKKAFGATEVFRLAAPDGCVAHAVLKIDGAMILLADEFPDMGYRGPHSLGGTPVTIHLYVTDVDARFKRAIAAGASELRPLQDQFYGDRSGTLVDPYGHVWNISSHKEDVPVSEIEKRFQAKMSKGAGA